MFSKRPGCSLLVSHYYILNLNPGSMHWIGKLLKTERESSHQPEKSLLTFIPELMAYCHWKIILEKLRKFSSTSTETTEEFPSPNSTTKCSSIMLTTRELFWLASITHTWQSKKLKRTTSSAPTFPTRSIILIGRKTTSAVDIHMLVTLMSSWRLCHTFPLWKSKTYWFRSILINCHAHKLRSMNYEICCVCFHGWIKDRLIVWFKFQRKTKKNFVPKSNQAFRNFKSFVLKL